MLSREESDTPSLKVAEIWIYAQLELKIYLLQDGEYQLSTQSQVFPRVPICGLIQICLQQAKPVGTRQMLKALHQYLSL